MGGETKGMNGGGRVTLFFAFTAAAVCTESHRPDTFIRGVKKPQCFKTRLKIFTTKFSKLYNAIMLTIL